LFQIVLSVVTTMHHVEHGHLTVKSQIINIFDATFLVRKVCKQVTMKAGLRFSLGMPKHHRKEAYCRRHTSTQTGRSVSTYRTYSSTNRLTQGVSLESWYTFTGIYGEYVKSLKGGRTVLLMVHLQCDYRL
jgi:hypothetical protein